MTLTVELPDRFIEEENPARVALEALAIAGYRSGTFSTRETRLILGFETRHELDGFLKQHKVWERSYGVEDYDQDLTSVYQHEASEMIR